ncbi:(acyl-carrier-protein) S-malonyltransferase [Lachnospiraceae bacterium JC7]|nr:(acyl-carrier-protein) S-malonyltransferase [Lachnospiraceae bacterium JC7]
MKTAFLYAGQGSQHAGMGADLYRDYPEFRRVFDGVSEGLQKNYSDRNYDLCRLCFEDPDGVINETRYTQPAMVAFACGVTEILKVHGIRPDYAAGLSLGEYSALQAAEVMDSETAVEMVAFRGQKMAEASEGVDCGMTAVLGMGESDLEACCEKVRTESGKIVSICNYNCPGQIVIGGEKEAVEMVAELASEFDKVRCIPLKVSGPFHTSYMSSAGDALQGYFRNIRMNRPKCNVLFNYLGDESEAVSSSVKSTTATTAAAFRKAIPELLVEQVQKPVRMEAIIRNLFAKGVTDFVEIGPGHTLSGFVKKVAKDMGISDYTVNAVETSEDVEKLTAR